MNNSVNYWVRLPDKKKTLNFVDYFYLFILFCSCFFFKFGGLSPSVPFLEL